MTMTIAPIAVSTALSFICEGPDECLCQLLRLPRLIVGRRGLGFLEEQAALRPISNRRSSLIGEMGLLPVAGSIGRRGGGLIDDLVHPTIPAWRNGRGFGVAVIDDPAPRAVFFLVVAVAELVFTDEGTHPRGVKPRAERRAVPPSENVREQSHGESVCH